MLIDWKDSYCTGITEIDDQHKVLIGWINRLEETIVPEKTGSAVWDLLIDFHRYADTHFTTEENLARSSAVPEEAQARHWAEHDAYRARIEEFRRSFVQDDPHAPVLLMAFLHNWWLSHIQGTDQELGRLLRSAGAC
ncbi:MAG: hemerythrin family protein [Rhodocyclaceae bacterium]|jgi:methyl-accepting chemotaxis protein/hemerythrin|nr:hemerythrin family protein [Rhodocyclaceae bacterium]MCL4759890.1 hemerythrin family protein [Rhodocyclaceae bacterium]